MICREHCLIWYNFLGDGTGGTYSSSVRLRKLLKFLIFATFIQKAIAKLFTNVNSSNPLNRQNGSKCELSHLELLAV